MKYDLVIRVGTAREVDAIWHRPVVTYDLLAEAGASIKPPRATLPPSWLARRSPSTECPTGALPGRLVRGRQPASARIA